MNHQVTNAATATYPNEHRAGGGVEAPSVFVQCDIPVAPIHKTSFCEVWEQNTASSDPGDGWECGEWLGRCQVCADQHLADACDEHLPECKHCHKKAAFDCIEAHELFCKKACEGLREALKVVGAA